MAKPTISPSEGVTKEEGQDQKNFHYIYILKKQVPIQETVKVAAEVEDEEEKVSDEEN